MSLRDSIIYILEKNRGSFVSGQAIAEEAGVSRSAVAKCVSQLKADGYPIASVNNMGHMLEQSCDILSESGIKANLEDFNGFVKVFDTIDSTSSEAKRMIAQGLNEPAIFAAEEQTAGRGRRGRSFFSPSKCGVYFSAVLYPGVALEDATAITAAAAVAVVEAIKNATKKDPKIKWVNDIFIDNKKVCGILTEAVSDFESGSVQAVIVGIGINLTTDCFPEELACIAGSLGKQLDRCALIADIFERLSRLCAVLPERSFMNDYREYSLVIGRSITFSRNGVDYTAVARSITDSGELEVLTDSGEIMFLNSGEISIRL
ncbi:MAG: biotin--[Clostridia bacterium]|nr:biotin--[acetyl-CoA-carboxylase] ligase [Clostridia bacterium]